MKVFARQHINTGFSFLLLVLLLAYPPHYYDTTFFPLIFKSFYGFS
jgi:hypothetical protein